VTTYAAALRQVPGQVWLLVGLAVSDFIVRLARLGVELTPTLVLSAANGAAMPLLLAAVALYVVPARRLVVGGAMLLAAAAVLDTGQRLVALPDVALMLLGLIIAGCTIVGVVMLGRALVRDYPAWALAVLALVTVFVVTRILAIADSYAAAGLFEQDSGPPLARAQLLVAAIAQLRYIAWAFLLTAAIGRRYWLIALGAALPIAAALTLAAVDYLARQTGLAYPLFGVLMSMLEIGGFAALIAGVVRELSPARAARAE
jgi:hypothetical protein